MNIYTFSTAKKVSHTQRRTTTKKVIFSVGVCVCVFIFDLFYCYCCWFRVCIRNEFLFAKRLRKKQWINTNKIRLTCCNRYLYRIRFSVWLKGGARSDRKPAHNLVDCLLRLKQMVNKISLSCIWKSTKTDTRLDNNNFVTTIYLCAREKGKSVLFIFIDLFFKWYRNSVENVIWSPFWKQVLVFFSQLFEGGELKLHIISSWNVNAHATLPQYAATQFSVEEKRINYEVVFARD